MAKPTVKRGISIQDANEVNLLRIDSKAEGMTISISNREGRMAFFLTKAEWDLIKYEIDYGIDIFKESKLEPSL